MVTWTQCVLYGLPGFGFGAVTVMISLFLPSLYADHLGVPLSAIGTVTSLVQVFDAVTDPVLGYVSDRLTSCGRRRPFMISGSWLLAGCFIALFTPPQTGTWSLSLAWAASWALLTQLMVTVARVPWLAWGIELSHDYHEKTRLVSLRELMWIFGSLAAAILPLILENVDLNEFAQLTVMSVFWALCIVVSGTVCFCTIPEGTSAAAEPPSSIWSFMRLLLTTRAAWSLWLAAVLMTMATTSNALLYPFFVRYVLQEEDGVSLLLGLYILVGALGVPFWAMASKRFDKRQSLALATLIQSLALLVAFVAVGAQSMAVYTGCILAAGLSFGGVPVIRFSMLADVADVLQLKAAGKKDEGKLVAVLDVSSKLAASALISVGFTVIDVSGYRADQAQGDSAKLAIRVFYGLVPALLGVFSALVILFLYPLDRAKHAEVLAELGKPETAKSTSVG